MKRENKSVDSTETQGKSGAGQQPWKSYPKVGSMRVALWKNRGVNAQGESYDFTTLSLSRSYREKNSEEWKEARISLRVNDIPRAIMLLATAYHDMLMEGREGPERAGRESAEEGDDEFGDLIL